MVPPHWPVYVSVGAQDSTRPNAMKQQTELRRYDTILDRILNAEPYASIIAGTGLDEVSISIWGVHDRPTRPQSWRPGHWDTNCALDGPAVLQLTADDRMYVLLRLCQVMLSRIPVLEQAVWPEVPVPADANKEALDQLIADALKPRPQRPKATHPVFRRHFTARIYDPRYPDGLFSTDEAADVWGNWRDTSLLPTLTVRAILDEVGNADDFIHHVRSSEDVREHSAVVATGFTLLRRTGRIDAEGHTWLVASLTAMSTAGDSAASQALAELDAASHLIDRLGP